MAIDGGELTCLTAVEIAAGISTGRFSASEAIEAHIARSQAAREPLNAIVAPLFDGARRAAAEVDEARRRGDPLGPLAGVPVTIKECFHVAGAPSTLGIERFRRERATADGPLVRRLRELGAIVLGLTNVPQLLLLHEVDNPVYGRTNNPWDLSRSPGGSSGGEAAIIAAGGSPWGLASDLGGSIRQPAHACGVHGLKPTTGRLSLLGKRGNFEGMEAIGVAAGPMARSVADLEWMLHLLLGAGDEADFQAVPVPLAASNQVAIDRLRIGFWDDDGYFPAAPAARRAVHEAAQALQTAGATVEPFRPPDAPSAAALYFALLSADGGANLRRTLGSEGPVDWRIRRLTRLGRLPSVVRQPLASAMIAVGQRRSGELLRATGGRSADGYWRLVAERGAYTRRFLAAMNAARLDALVCPPHALPAMRHGDTALLAPAASYCFLPNLLNMPAGVVAATRVLPGEETDRSASRDQVDQAAKAAETGSAGLPIGVQIFARHWREDLVLAVMSFLESHFRRQADYPRTPILAAQLGELPQTR